MLMSGIHEIKFKVRRNGFYHTEQSRVIGIFRSVEGRQQNNGLLMFSIMGETDLESDCR